MQEFSLTVEKEDSNIRLDVYLTQNLSEIPSRTFVKRIIDSENVSVNGKKAKVSYKVRSGDKIQVNIPKLTISDVEPENIPLDIFYEDNDIAVINKPSGMLVHPANGFYINTLVNALLYHFEELSDVNQPNRPGIVHRLDKETSGLIVIAKNNRAHVRLARQFEKHKVKKCYFAIVEGSVEFDEGVIDAALGRHPHYREKKKVSYRDGKDAKTFYRVIKRLRNTSLVELFPQTGRTHQLRVHMKHLGHPILGDDKYGNKDSFVRLALHAKSIGFIHPIKSKYVEFSSVVPTEFFEFISK